MCGSTHMDTHEARFVCQSCGLVGDADPSCDDDRMRYLDDSGVARADGVQEHAGVGARGSTVVEGRIRNAGSAMAKTAKYNRMHGAAQVLRQSSQGYGAAL